MITLIWEHPREDESESVPHMYSRIAPFPFDLDAQHRAGIWGGGFSRMLVYYIFTRMNICTQHSAGTKLWPVNVSATVLYECVASAHSSSSAQRRRRRADTLLMWQACACVCVCIQCDMLPGCGKSERACILCAYASTRIVTLTLR